MSEKDQPQQPSAPDHEQTREGARPQAEGGGAGRGRGGGRHGGGRRRHGQQQPTPQGAPRRAENSLNMQELRDLMDLFTSHGLTEFEIENEEIRVRLSRNLAPPQAQQAPQAPYAPAEGFQQAVPASAAASAAQESAVGGGGAGAGGGSAADSSSAEAAHAEEKAEDLHIITSPIVGTFYRSPSPTAEPFVKQGSRVDPDTIVCIIEAMKLMNEIQAETTGVIEKIYVENGQPVEYGQPLFGVKR